MFRVALVLVRIALGEPGCMAQCPTMYETLEKLRRLPIQNIEEEFLVQEVCIAYFRIIVITWIFLVYID